MSDEIETRVKALETDLAELQRKLTGVTGALELLIKEVDELRRSARRVY